MLSGDSKLRDMFISNRTKPSEMQDHSEVHRTKQQPPNSHLDAAGRRRARGASLLLAAEANPVAFRQVVIFLAPAKGAGASQTADRRG